MTSFYDSYDYYKKMLQLQEKLRRSEEERIRLEERFKMLVQESRSRHDACINRLRLRYIEFLEEQRARDERNRKLLETLERVDDKLASMTAKTDRLNALRKQYEAYLRGIYTAADPSAITVADNTTVSQTTDRYSRSDGQPTVSFSPQVFRFSGNFQTDSTKSSNAIQPSYRPYRAEQKIAIAPLPAPRHQLNDAHDISRSRQLILQPTAPTNLQSLQTKEKWSRRGSIGTQTSVSLDPSEHRFPSAALVDPHPAFSQPTQSYSHLSFGDGLPRRINLSDTIYRTIPAASAIQQTVCNSLKPLSPPPVSYFEYSWRKSENYLKAKENSMRDTAAARSLASCSGDGARRRYDSQKRFSPKTWSSPRPWDSRQLAERHPPEHRTAKTVENELDQYIDKIRRLHRELDAQSVEDICSLNEKEKIKEKEDENGFSEGRSKESVPKEVERVLALANDLASKTVELNDANIDSGNVGEDRHVELVENTRTDRDAPLPQRTDAVLRANEGRESTLGLAKDKISSDIKLHSPKLDPDGNIEKTEKRSTESDGDGGGGRSRELPADSFEVPSLHRPTDPHAEFTRGNVQTVHSNHHRYSFDIAEELQLEPWNLSLLQKQVKEIDLETENTKDSKQDTEWVEEEEIARKNETEAEAEAEAEADAEAQLEAKVEGMGGSLQDRNVEYQEHEKAEEHEEPEKIACDIAVEEKQGNILSDANERNEEEIATGQANEYNDPNYYVNYEEYNYDENATYETNREENYEKNQASSYEANQEGNYDATANAAYETDRDPNATYGSNQNNENDTENENENEKYQEYAEQSNEQYQAEEYVGEQYGYENQYGIAHDPNTPYQEDSNQQYAYSYEQPYDPVQMQTSDGDGDGNVNQPLPYSDYDPDPTASLLNLQEEKPNAEYKQSQEESEIIEPEAEMEEGQEEGKEEKEEQEEQEEKEEKEDTVEKEKLSSEREVKKKKDAIRSLLDSDTDSTIERNASNTESDFDFN